MTRLMRWVVPDRMFGGYRDQLRVFYEKYWITCRVEDRVLYMATYGVDR